MADLITRLQHVAHDPDAATDLGRDIFDARKQRIPYVAAPLATVGAAAAIVPQDDAFLFGRGAARRSSKRKN